MTSQVILSNSYGIAIASDSAVSVNDRVLTGVEKILPLPAPHKLAIVISNCASFMDVPWESIVHKWSGELPEPLESLPMYWSSLSNWLKENLPNLQSVKNVEANAILRVIRITEWHLYKESLIPFLHEKLGNQLDSQEWSALDYGKPSPDLVVKVSKLLPIDEFKEFSEYLANLSQNAWDELIEQDGHHYGEVVTSFLESRISESGLTWEEDFASRWPHAESLLPYLLEQIPRNLSRLDYDFESVLCFAGYGAQDVFPSLIKVSVFQMYGGVVQDGNYTYCEPAPHSQFLLLGQKNALENLIYGLDSKVEQAFLATEHKINVMKDLVPADSTNIRDYVQKQADNSVNRMKIQERNKEEHLYNLIASSPLKNLGLFAGSLVSVQAAFATITQANPSVAGTIDIATINIGAGFTWLRHEK